MDIASTGGLISLLAYLSILAAAFYYLFKGKKKGKISTNEFVLLVCLFVAYFIQNLAVFDSLVTYISLMLTLGYVYWLNNRDEDEELSRDEGLTNKEIGKALHLSSYTIKSHIHNILEKMAVNTRLQIAKYANSNNKIKD